jgi:hypothetical protein
MLAWADMRLASDAADMLVHNSCGDVGGVLLRSSGFADVAPTEAGGGVAGMVGLARLSCGEWARYLRSISAGEEAGGVKTRLFLESYLRWVWSAVEFRMVSKLAEYDGRSLKDWLSVERFNL